MLFGVFEPFFIGFVSFLTQKVLSFRSNLITLHILQRETIKTNTLK